MDLKERMSGRRWGVFNHYICWPEQSLSREEAAKQWNERVDSFDVEKLAETLHKMGAGYYFITVIHGAEYMIAPNSAYEKLVGMPEGTVCSKRDLIEDLYNALSKYDIDLCLYYNALSPFNDCFGADCRKNIFGREVEVTQRDTFKYVDGNEYVAKWAQPMKELSMRYGDKIKMWWMDSSYDYSGYTADMLKVYHDAIKAGNPDALIGFNQAELLLHPEGGLVKTCEYEELTCGENEHFNYLPTSGDIDGALTHLLIPLGSWWAERHTEYTHEFIRDYVHKVNEVGGIVTIDIFVGPDGSFDEEQCEVLTGI